MPASTACLRCSASWQRPAQPGLHSPASAARPAQHQLAAASAAWPVQLGLHSPASAAPAPAPGRAYAPMLKSSLPILSARAPQQLLEELQPLSTMLKHTWLSSGACVWLASCSDTGDALQL